MGSRLKCNWLLLLMPLFSGMLMNLDSKVNAQERQDSLPRWKMLQQGIYFWEHDAPE